jgi:hypothetical protein
VSLVRTDTANVRSSLILFTMMIEAICSSETLVVTRATRRHIREDGILRDEGARRQ